MEAILTIGISGSGKSTWANDFVLKNKNYVIIEKDKIRSSIQNIDEGHVVWDMWRWSGEKTVNKKQTEMINNCFENKQNIIISDTNISPKTRKYFEELFKQNDYKIMYKYFDIDIGEAIKRDSLRKYPVGRPVIETQYKKYKEIKI